MAVLALGTFGSLLVTGSLALAPTTRTAPAGLVPPTGPTAIAGGSIDETNQYPSVVAIQAHTQRCTGLVVAPQVVLTAAHCLESLDYGRTVTIYPDVQAPSENRAQGLAWSIHPDYCPDCRESQFDFGFIELFQEIDPPGGLVAPLASRAEWDAVMRPGVGLTAVGYGAQQEGVNDPWARRVAELRVKTILRDGLELEAGASNAGTCDGDSGGPAFVRLADGSLRWAGINSRGYGCGATTVYGASFTTLCWLRDGAGVDLLPAGCESCDCVETSEGCSCRTSARPSFLLLGTLLLLGRRGGPRTAERQMRRSPGSVR